MLDLSWPGFFFEASPMPQLADIHVGIPSLGRIQRLSTIQTTTIPTNTSTFVSIFSLSLPTQLSNAVQTVATAKKLLLWFRPTAGVWLTLN
jgi:hypothetical protein